MNRCYSYNGKSLQELICQHFKKINECVDDVNKYTELVKNLLIWIEKEGLGKEVDKILTKWKDNGTLKEIIDEQVFKDIINGLNGRVKFFEDDFSKKYKKHMEIGAQRLMGNSKYSPSYAPVEGQKEVIKLVGNESTLIHFKIDNPDHLAGKTGINTNGTQKHHMSDLIVSNFDVGIDMKQTYYNYLSDIVMQNNDKCVVLGDYDHKERWVGAITLDSFRIGASRYGFINYAEDNTRSLVLQNTSVEGINHTIENFGQFYIKNTYIGDQHQRLEESKDGADYIAQGQPGSVTVLNDCQMGMTNRKYKSPKKSSAFSLMGDNSKPCEMYINGGAIQLSNNNTPDYGQNMVFIYTSASGNNKIYIDNVDFIPSTLNANHNQIPYYLYDGFTCLESLYPIKSYLKGGLFLNHSENEKLVNGSSGKVAYTQGNIMNPFGGKLIDVKPDGSIKIPFKVPEHMLYKELILEFYVSDGPQDHMRVKRHSAEGLEQMDDFYFTAPALKDGLRTPILQRCVIKPTRQEGNIEIIVGHNAPKNLTLAGLCLKDKRYKNKLSKYEEI